MSNVKLLISGLTNIGKTSLLQSLTDVLVVARDGKKYPFEQPHVNIDDFTSIDTVINIIFEKVEAYEKKIDSMPKTIVIDSISKIVLDIEGYVLDQVKSFPYGKVNTEIKKFVDFIERDLCTNFNVILVSHALFNEDTSGYSLVNAGGSYGKKGGVLSEVDEAIFLELRSNKRIIHFRNSKMAARTVVNELADSMPAEEFNLQEHIEMLQKKRSKSAEWSL
ncbi:MAG: AAA family ATPase [Gammaproteobacteria bacterium]|nr:AAA family ATPase [Gammaproteobacteria bacterium]